VELSTGETVMIRQGLHVLPRSDAPAPGISRCCAQCFAQFFAAVGTQEGGEIIDGICLIISAEIGDEDGSLAT